jgi:tRNA(Ile)-lysidine synthase TilS/MesJ
MAGRRPLREGIDLARPLLQVDPAALRAYCHARALPYAVDPTNSESGKRRSAVREALESLRPLFPGLDRAVARAADVIAEETKGSRRADLRRTVRERLGNDDALRDLDFAHVEAAVRALENGRSGTFFMKPGIGLRIESGAMRGIITEE